MATKELCFAWQATATVTVNRRRCFDPIRYPSSALWSLAARRAAAASHRGRSPSVPTISPVGVRCARHAVQPFCSFDVLRGLPEIIFVRSRACRINLKSFSGKKNQPNGRFRHRVGRIMTITPIL